MCLLVCKFPGPPSIIVTTESLVNEKILLSFFNTQLYFPASESTSAFHFGMIFKREMGKQRWNNSWELSHHTSILMSLKWPVIISCASSCSITLQTRSTWLYAPRAKYLSGNSATAHGKFFREWGNSKQNDRRFEPIYLTSDPELSFCAIPIEWTVLCLWHMSITKALIPETVMTSGVGIFISQLQSMAQIQKP